MRLYLTAALAFAVEAQMFFNPEVVFRTVANAHRYG